jgi:hypothetical protein
MVAGRLLTTGSPRELLAPLAGRVLELKAAPRRLAHRICQADSDVEYVATYGELLRMHLRVDAGAAQAGDAGGVLRAGPYAKEIEERLSRALAAAGVQVTDLRPVAPSLEDVFIAVLQGTPVQATAGEAPHG